MGWSSANDIFDETVNELLNEDAGPPETMVARAIATLHRMLEEHDWDTFCESEFYTHPKVRAAIEVANPGYDWGD